MRVPGDKSIAQRVVMFGALANGVTRVEGFPDAGDAHSTLKAVVQLGAQAEFRDSALYIVGTGGQLQPPAVPLDMGNSGTGARLLAGLLAGAGIEAEIIGDSSLSSRPMGRIQLPLARMGATIELTGARGTLPMTVRNGQLKGITYELPMASAQVKSCLLLAGLFADGPTTVVEPRPTRDHTERLFQKFGIPIRMDGLKVAIPGHGDGGPRVNACGITVPGDFSSAAFWIVAVAARPGASLRIERVGLNPRRTVLLNVMRRMGAEVSAEIEEEAGDPYGTITVQGAVLQGTVIGGDEIPGLIDELPILSVAGALAKGRTAIRDAAELRVKESDRIAEMVRLLRSFGVDVEEAEDGMTVYGPAALKTPPAMIGRLSDHRIVMSMAVLNSFADKPLDMEAVDCVDTSYPAFWEHMKHLGGRVE